MASTGRPIGDHRLSYLGPLVAPTSLLSNNPRLLGGMFVQICHVVRLVATVCVPKPPARRWVVLSVKQPTAGGPRAVPLDTAHHGPMIGPLGAWDAHSGAACRSSTVFLSAKRLFLLVGEPYGRAGGGGPSQCRGPPSSAQAGGKPSKHAPSHAGGATGVVGERAVVAHPQGLMGGEEGGALGRAAP